MLMRRADRLVVGDVLDIKDSGVIAARFIIEKITLGGEDNIYFHGINIENAKKMSITVFTDDYLNLVLD